MRILSAIFLTLCLAVISGSQAEAQTASGLSDSLPGRWLYNEHFNQTLPTEDAWWKKFDDPMLDSLIALGVKNNYNVLMAARRMEIARLNILQARSGYFPTINANAGWNKGRTSGMTGKTAISPVSDSYFSLGLTMSWQIDIFGRIAAESKARKAQWSASRAQYDATMVTLCGNVATAYMNLRVYQAEKAVALSHMESQQKVVNIAQARFDCGLASQLDVQQAKTVYASTEASVPMLDAQIHATINSLAVMLAILPAEANAMLEAPKPMPSYIQIVQTGVPMDLLRRRPDVVEAEKMLAVYAAELGIAKKDFLPALSLNASIGTAAHNIGDLFKHDSYTYSIAPTLSWTVFDGMSRKYNVASARQNMEIGIQNYNLTILQALTEADNAMMAYVDRLREIELLNEAVKASEESLKLSLDLYKRGLADFTNVVDAQLNFLTYTNNVVVAQGNAIASLINLYEALGGGWGGEEQGHLK